MSRVSDKRLREVLLAALIAGVGSGAVTPSHGGLLLERWDELVEAEASGRASGRGEDGST